MRIPVIGSDAGGDWFNRSPMFFPQNSSGKQLVLTPVASATVSMLPKGTRKLGMIYCSDGVQICEDARQIVPGEAKRYGFDFVYSGSGSLAQPDFTANCLAARDAGAQMLLMIMDRNSAQRVARGCSNVGYKPVLLLSHTVSNDALATDPNLQGSVGVSLVAPWIDSANPAVSEFRKAMAAFAPGVDASGMPIVGWAAAKVFERAMRDASGAVTSATVLSGLWTMKADTLGGLTPPLTFVQDQPAARYVCYWPLLIEGKKFVNASDGQGRCT
jgi:branched-chain amino acid transport system substrate-binding protein